MKTELFEFKTLDSSNLRGVIYKPDNFDNCKQYPVIIHYYEKLSNKLNEFHKPGLTSDDINIPWFVSRGYVVFTPDIDYRIGEPGLSAFNAVVGGAKYLSKYP